MISLSNLKFTNPQANTLDDSTHEYVNIEILNEYSPENTQPKPIIFAQTKSSAIVDKANDYYLSVTRWNIQSNLPVLIPDILINPVAPVPEKWETSYRLAFGISQPEGTVINPTNPAYTVAGVAYSQPLQFSSLLIDTNYQNQLTYPKNTEELYSNPYFYIHYVDTFCDMINNAINDYLEIGGGITWTKKPYFKWDSNAGKIVYYAPNQQPSGVGGFAAGDQMVLLMNQPLYNLLSTFRFGYIAQGAGNSALFPETQVCRYVLGDSITSANQQTTGDYTIKIQQSSSVANWSPAKALVFLSTSLPVEPQMSGAPFNLNSINPTTTSNIYQQQGISTVLTDFVLPFVSGVEATNQPLYYLPTAEFRLIDLLGESAVNQLYITVSWRDKFGVLHPVTLDAGASAQILILLRKKRFNGGTVE